MEKIDGSELASLRMDNTFNPYSNSGFPSSGEIKNYCEKILDIFAQIIVAIHKIHQRDIIVGDISPRNIFYDADSNNISIIDFESAFFIDSEQKNLKMGNFGYVKKQGATNNFNSDYYAIGMLLMSMFYPVQSVIELDKNTYNKFLGYLNKKRGIPSSIINLIKFLVENEYKSTNKICNESLKKIKKARESLKKGDINFNLKPTIDNENIAPKIKPIAEAITTAADIERNDRLFPADYRIFNTNPLSIAYGGVGVLLALKHMGHKVEQRYSKWILEHEVDNLKYPPGFYMGTSGIAFGLYQLGLKKRAEKYIKMSNESDMKYERLNIFYGTAGIGLANLFLFKNTEKKYYLDEANKCATKIIEMSSKNLEGSMYYKDENNSVTHGFAFGASGIGFFFMKLYEISDNKKHKSIAQSFIEYDLSEAQNDHGNLKWPGLEMGNAYTPNWYQGASGIISALIRYYKITSEERYKRLAKKAIRPLFGKNITSLGQFSGMSGIGELFLDMFQVTGEKKYENEALRIAETISLFEIKENNNIEYPGERLLRISTDFATGSSGIGVFYKRLITGKGRLIYDF